MKNNIINHRYINTYERGNLIIKDTKYGRYIYRIFTENPQDSIWTYLKKTPITHGKNQGRTWNKRMWQVTLKEMLDEIDIGTECYESLEDHYIKECDYCAEQKKYITNQFMKGAF